MATPMKITQKLIILLQTQTTPTVVYEAPCSFNTTRSISFETGVVEVPTGDCDNPDKPAWIARAADTFSSGISGGGTLHTKDFKVWRDWYFSGLPKVCRIKLDEPLADGGGDFQGEYILTSFELGKEGRGYVTFAAELQSNGEVAWTDAAA